VKVHVNTCQIIYLVHIINNTKTGDFMVHAKIGHFPKPYNTANIVVIDYTW
jgi:hypothetical protein